MGTRQRELQEQECHRQEEEQRKREINDRAFAERRIEAARDAINNQQRIEEQAAQI